MTKNYQHRIYQSLSYIDENLDQDLNLSILAKVANYSPFHFHRLFKAVTGQSPNKYVLRIRIERSAYQIKKDKARSLSEIAYNNGFESLANFSKSFKKYYGVSPSQLKENSDYFSKIRQVNRKNGQTGVEISNDLYAENKLKPLNSVIPIKISNIPSLELACVNYVGPFEKIGSAYSTVMKWAMLNDVQPICQITQFYDSPEVTDLHQIRQSAGVQIHASYALNDVVSFSTINGGRYAVGKFVVEMNELDQAWQTMMVWVAEQDLIPDEKQRCFEKYSLSEARVDQKKTIEIFIPIKK